MVVGTAGAPLSPVTPQAVDGRTLRRGAKGMSFAVGGMADNNSVNDGSYLDGSNMDSSTAGESESSSMAGDFSSGAAGGAGGGGGRPESTFSNMSLGPPLSPIDFEERRASMFDGNDLPGGGDGGGGRGNRVSFEGTEEPMNVATAGRKESAAWAGL